MFPRCVRSGRPCERGPDPSATRNPLDLELGSRWRLEYADAFLRTSVDRSVAELQQLLRTYPLVFAGSGGMDFRTGVSVIWTLSEQAAYIAPDRPDLTD